MSSFSDWLLQNDIPVPDSLKNKMETKYIASVGTLSELKKLGDSDLAQVITDLELTVIEKAVFNHIMTKIDGPSSNNLDPGAQITTIVPEIISIVDNKNGTVNVKWKLVFKPLDKESKNRLKLEWSEDEKAMDFDHTNDELIEMNKIDLNSIHETKNIVIKNINANIFRLKWRNFSNVKQMKIETDLWDENNQHKGQHIQVVNGNVIKHNAVNTFNSIYGKVTCKAPYKYHWQFKIKAFVANFMFGVAKISNGYKCKGSHLGSGEVGYYVSGTNNAYVYNTGGNYQGEYGMQRFNKNGCILDMYLDLENYSLNFKTGGQETGVTISNLPQEDYRMIVTLYNKQQIELVAFDYH